MTAAAAARAGGVAGAATAGATSVADAAGGGTAETDSDGGGRRSVAFSLPDAADASMEMVGGVAGKAE